MRAIWELFLLLAMVGAAMVLAGFAVFFIRHYFVMVIFMIIMGSLLLLLYTNLQKRLNAKMTIIEERVEREQNEDVVLYQTDPVTGMTVPIARKKHLLETENTTEFLPSSDALLIAMKIASSLQQGLATLDFRATYLANLERSKAEKPDLQVIACKKQLQRELQQTFEGGDYWQKINEQLDNYPLCDLINHAVDFDPPSVKEPESTFFLRDTPVDETTLTEKYEVGNLVYETAILPVANCNYPPTASHRLMFHSWPLLADAQAFTQLPATALLRPGFYRVIDQYTFRDKTMILFYFLTTNQSITEVQAMEQYVGDYSEIIAKAHAHFEASFELTTPEEFSSDYWRELMKPLLGKDDA